MPGKVLEVLVNQGQQVKAGEPLMVLEAMKMEKKLISKHPLSCCIYLVKSIKNGVQICLV